MQGYCTLGGGEVFSKIVQEILHKDGLSCHPYPYGIEGVPDLKMDQGREMSWYNAPCGKTDVQVHAFKKIIQHSAEKNLLWIISLSEMYDNYESIVSPKEFSQNISNEFFLKK